MPLYAPVSVEIAAAAVALNTNEQVVVLSTSGLVVLR